jgi:L-glutamine-phosphate cytidylyltransferase
MKAVILAAGMGTRLGTLIPKPLTSIKNEKTILDFQIENLTKFVSIHDILIVVGYKKEIIMEKYPDLTFIYNDAYTKTNTSKSLLRALNKIDNSDVLWLNGDVYFDKSVIEKLKNEKSSSVLVDNKKCGDEEVKYLINSNGDIKKISKTVKNGVGEALGINYIISNDLNTFKKHLENVDDQDYFEKGIENMIIKDKTKIRPVNIDNLFCQEVDFPEDLESVKKYISQNK